MAADARFTDLRQRAMSAAILGPIAVLCIWLGAEAWTAMIAVAIAVLTWEWVHLCGLRTRTMPGAAVPIVVFIACTAAVAERPSLALLLLLAGFAATWAFAHRARDPLRPGQPELRLALGVLYIGLAGIALIELRHDGAAGRANVLFLVGAVWASDIGAYAVGRLIGGPKLAPAISPGKTWSGAVGGVLAAMATCAVIAAWQAPGPWPRVLAVALLLSLASQAGDLLESAVKRHFRVKDTSSLIPGHGGLLDRLDGVLAAAPVAALLSLALGYGVPLWHGMRP